MIAVHQDRDRVLGVHGEELWRARATTQHVHVHILIVQVQHVQGHVDSTRGRRQQQTVQLKLRVCRHLAFDQPMRTLGL